MKVELSKDEIGTLHERLVGNEYDKQAEDFLRATGTVFSAVFVANKKHFEDDEETRDVYRVTLKRGEREFSFDFGQSVTCSGAFVAWTGSGKVFLHDAKEASRYRAKHFQVVRNEKFEEARAYDVLCCLQKYDVGSFEEFCSEFGYDSDSRKVERMYNAVKAEFQALERLYSPGELELMQKIQ